MKKKMERIIQSFGKILQLQWGLIVKKIEKVKEEKFTTELIDNFFKNGRSSYAEGLASLYTYERQIPEIAETKLEA